MTAEPKDSIESIVTSLRWKYLSGLLIVGAASLLCALSLNRQLDNSQSDGHLINLAGRQRMLSQVLARHVIAIDPSASESDRLDQLQRLGRATDNFLEGHSAISGKSSQGNHDFESHPIALEYLIQMEPQIERINSLLRTLRAHADADEDKVATRGSLGANGGDETERLLSQTDAYLADMDRVVHQLANDARAKVEQQQYVSLGCALLIVFLVLMIGLVVIEPAVAMLRNAEEQQKESQDLASKNQKTILESSMFSDAVLNTAADGIFVIDLSGNIERANPAAHRIFEAEPGSLIGTDVTNLMGEFDRIHHHEYIQRYLDTGNSSVIGGTREVRAKRRNGEDFTAELSVAVMEWQGKKAFTGFIRDVTARKQLEEELAQAHKFESIGQLAAGVAHEINTPLQCVTASIEFLSDSSEALFRYMEELSRLGASADDEALRKEAIAKLSDTTHIDYLNEQFPGALGDCEVSVKRVIDIIRAMKDFSHPGLRSKARFDLNQCIESAITMSRNRWKHVAEMHADLTPDGAHIHGYQGELNQVILNLLVNAADAIAEEPPANKLGEIRVATRNTESGVELTVKDSGCGMSEEVLRRAYDPFFTTKDVGKGTGQGLAISYDVVVNKHGGTIDVQSQPGEGTEFTVRLPFDAARDEPPEQATRRGDLVEA